MARSEPPCPRKGLRPRSSRSGDPSISPFLSGRRTQTPEKGPVVTDLVDQKRPHAARPSPFRLNLDQQRRRARELQRGLRAGDPDAVQRFARHHPNGGLPQADLARLAEAQLVIARELGLPSWARLKAHILAMRQARAAIATTPALDGDMPTLHLRCGSDIRTALSDAGLSGAFLEYSEALCQGPVLDRADWLDRRADFQAEAYGAVMGLSRADIAARTAHAEAALRDAAQQHERVVLWFEHDSFDQLVLARCLAAFADRPPRRLELISVNHYPGATRFIGLGQLPPEAIRLLWHDRRPISAAQLALGRTVWDRLRAADPTSLAAIAAAGTPDLPDLAPALRRHCQELPWTRDGLGLTERLVLQLLAERPHSIGEIFAALMRGREPLPWLGDIMLLWIITSMRRARQPVLTGAFTGDGRRWAQEELTITELGRDVLAGRTDWLALAPPERWLGGVLIAAGKPGWRWDDTAGRPIKQARLGALSGGHSTR